MENFTEKIIGELKEKQNKYLTRTPFTDKNQIKENFQIFLFEHIKNNLTGINFTYFFTQYLQKNEAKGKNSLKEICYPTSGRRVGIYICPFVVKADDNTVNIKNNNNINDHMLVFLYDPIDEISYYYLQKNCEKCDEDQMNDKIYLSFSTLKQLKNDFDFYEEYLQDYIIESEDFNFYFDIEKFRLDNKFKKILENFEADYSQKFLEGNLIGINKIEIKYVELLKELFYKYRSHLLHSNNPHALKAVFSSFGIDLIDIQLN